MDSILLRLFILLNVFTKGFCREYEVHYEVNNFEELAKVKFQIRRSIVKRSANSSSTSSPSNSPQATPSIGATNGKPFFSTTDQPSDNNTVPPADISTHHSTELPTNPATDRDIVTTRFPQLFTTPVPTNNTNGTSITIHQDNHKYYKSHYYPSGEKWWFDLNDGSGTPQLHAGLTKNLQFSDTIKTKFKFPYYGHQVNEVTITNKGFLFLGEKLHKFNASMQYVAPLMADFGAHLHNKTSIHYVDTGDRFTVEWRNMKLQNQQGIFSFQCSILENGTIIFAYKDISVAVSEIKNDTFPVRVGMSDAFLLRYLSPLGLYYINGRIYFRIRYFVYYRYHVVEFGQDKVKNGSAFVLTPLPNCILFKSCKSCIASKTQFSCKWCPKLKRCSDGFDRHRHTWLAAKCHENSKTTCTQIRPRKTTPSTRKTTLSTTKTTPSTRKTTPSTRKTTPPTRTTATGAIAANKKTKSGGSSSNKRAGIAVLIVFCLFVLIVIACLFAYAYTHPLSKSGMILMQYGNPRKWCGRAGSGDSGGGKITFKSMSHESIA